MTPTPDAGSSFWTNVLKAAGAALAKVVPGYTAQPKQVIAQDLADDPDVFEMLYGGAAGGGKSFWIRADAVRFCLNHDGAYVAIVRRTLPMLKKTHARPLQDMCHDLAEHNKSELTWTFPNGSVLQLISLQHDGDEQNYKSVEFDRLYFDELTEFTEGQYTYMLSRLRSQKGHPTTAISATNPEGVGFSWVKRRFVKPRPADLAAGQEAPKALEKWRPPMPDGKGFQRGRVFVPATVLDNPALLAANPDYADQLRAIPDARKRKALLEGDWDAMDQVPGALFSVSNIDAHRVASCPQLARRVVAVDPAGSAAETADDTGIIVAGKTTGARADYYVLADRTVHLDADGWARAAVQAYIDFECDEIVVEKNFGGTMTGSVLKNAAKQMRAEGLIDHMPRITEAGAKQGKKLRADPVAVLYANGQVHHCGELVELEEQMTTWIPDSGQDSPDRMDALVWAITRLDQRVGPVSVPIVRGGRR